MAASGTSGDFPRDCVGVRLARGQWAHAMSDPSGTQDLEQAFEAWIEAFRGPLVGLLASWGSDWGAAEELAQDTFAEAWLSRARFAADPGDLGAAGAWLRGIAFRLHQSALRKRQRQPTLPLPEEQPAPTRAVDERKERLAAAFTELSASHQTILRMHYLERTSTLEVAALLGLTPKAVERRLYQARRALRAAVARTAPHGAQELRS